jgi:hypothetical protein
MIYVTLRFPDQPTAVTVAKALGYWDDETDQLRTAGQEQRSDGTYYSWGIDVIGDVVDTMAVMNDDGTVAIPAVYRPGWFVNVIGEELPSGLAEYELPYGSAGRVFAGTDQQ